MLQCFLGATTEMQQMYSELKDVVEDNKQEIETLKKGLKILKCR